MRQLNTKILWLICILFSLSACGLVGYEFEGAVNAGSPSPNTKGGNHPLTQKPASSEDVTVRAGNSTEKINCASKSIRCVGPGEEYNTSRASHVETVIQSAVDDAKPGDTIKLRGGTYRHQLTSKSDVFLRVAVDGRENAPITIEPFAGETVKFEGFGFDDNAYDPKRKNERLIDVSGDFIHIRNLELSRSSRWGLVINGNHGLYENLRAHNCWGSNIFIRAEGGPVEGNVIRHVESYLSRHGTGIAMISASGQPQIIRNNVIEYSLAHDNGHLPNGEISPKAKGDAAGGGNSDGIAVAKGCHDDRHRYNMDNLCPGNLIRGNIAWNNADDGFDVSFAQGSAVTDNISFNNGPKGNKGYKVFSRVQGGINFLGNIAMSQRSFGFEIQFEDAGLVYHNTSVQSQSAALSASAFHPKPGSARLVNNLAAYSGAYLRDGKGFEKLTNHWEDRSGNPRLVEQTFSAKAVDISGAGTHSVAEKWQAIRTQFLRALAPAKGSPLIDAGTAIPGVHCKHADDNPDTPMPADADCRHWSGKAPDIGAVEFKI